MLIRHLTVLTCAALTVAAGCRTDSETKSEKAPDYGFAGQTGSFVADNAQHGLQVELSDNGVMLRQNIAPTIVSAEGEWDWRFALARFGRTDDVAFDSKTAPVVSCTDGATGECRDRIEYRRGALVEWYRNTADGIEQGFDIAARPDGDGELRVSGRFEGSLQGKLAPAADAVVFHDAAGTRLLAYHSLVTVDAAGRQLPSRMELDDDRIDLVIDDRNAVYPIVIDPHAGDPDPCPSDWCSDGNPCTVDTCADDGATCTNSFESALEGTTCGGFEWAANCCGDGLCHASCGEGTSGSCKPGWCNDGNPCSKDTCNDDGQTCSYAFDTAKAGDSCVGFEWAPNCCGDSVCRSDCSAAPSGPTVPFASTGDLFILDDGCECVLRYNTSTGELSVFLSEDDIRDATGDSDVDFDEDNGIVFDAGGNFYFTEGDNESILRWTTDGTLTRITSQDDIEAVTGDTSADPEAITMGPDGFLYVLDDDSNDVLRVNPATGDVSIFISETTIQAATGIGDFEPDEGIVAAADGSLFISNDGNPDGVVEISAAGVPSLLATHPDWTDFDLAITLDAAGNLVGQDDNSNAIYRITRAGVVTELISEAAITAVLGQDARLDSGIAYDAAGNLFFGDDGTDSIQRFTPSGELTVVLTEPQIEAATGDNPDLVGGFAFAPGDSVGAAECPSAWCNDSDPCTVDTCLDNAATCTNAFDASLEGTSCASAPWSPYCCASDLQCHATCQ